MLGRVQKEHYSKDHLTSQHGKLDSEGILEQMVWFYHMLRLQTEGCFKGEEKKEKADLVSDLKRTEVEVTEWLPEIF